MRINEENDGVSASRDHLVFAYYVTGHGFGHATRVVEVQILYPKFSDQFDHGFIKSIWCLITLFCFLLLKCCEIFVYIYIWRIHWWNLNGMRWWYECRWLGSWFWRGMMCTWWPVLLILFSPLRFSPLASSFARSSNYFLFVSLESSIYIYIYIRSFCSRFLTSQITCVMHVKF